MDNSTAKETEDCGDYIWMVKDIEILEIHQILYIKCLQRQSQWLVYKVIVLLKPIKIGNFMFFSKITLLNCLYLLFLYFL